MIIVACPMCGKRNQLPEEDGARPMCSNCGQRLWYAGADEVLEITDSTFRTVVKEAGGKPLAVDCRAQWCGPSELLAPAIEQIAREGVGKWVIARLDVDDNPRMASQFDISSIPTVLIFKDGELVDRLVGVEPKGAIESRLARWA